VARATQLILQHETDLTHTVDPLAGAPLVESLTEQFVASARREIERIEAEGGMTRAVLAGAPQARIAEAAARHKARLDREEDILVGVNRFAEGASAPFDVRVIDDANVRRVQIEGLVRLRETRDRVAVEAALSDLESAARQGRNLMDVAGVCMRARATLGEVSERLARVFGRHVPQASAVGGVFASSYDDEVAWQGLLNRVVAFEKRTGRRPRVLIAKLGQDGHDRGQKVIASGLADLGFDVDLGPLFQTPEEVARIAVDHDVHVVGVSTQAGAHGTAVPQLMEALSKHGAPHVLVVVGGIIPERDHPALFASGVRAIFLPGTRITEAADRLLALLEGPREN